MTLLPRGVPLILITFLGVSCRHLETRAVDPAQPIPDIRVSDRYSREAVASYEAFDGRIAGHAFLMMHLISGETFPMLCRVETGGVAPIPQSVFAAGEPATKWSLLCEPTINQTHALMSLEVSVEEGIPRMGARPLKPLSLKPRLLPERN